MNLLSTEIGDHLVTGDTESNLRYPHVPDLVVLT